MGTGRGKVWHTCDRAKQNTKIRRMNLAMLSPASAGVSQTRERRGQTKAVCDSDDHGWGLGLG